MENKDEFKKGSLPEDTTVAVKKSKWWVKYQTPAFQLVVISLLINATVILQTRVFDSAKEKEQFKLYMDVMLNYKELELIKNHVLAPEIHQSIEEKDSLFISQKEQDSVYSLYNHQWKTIEDYLDIIDNKLDRLGRNQKAMLIEFQKQNPAFKF